MSRLPISGGDNGTWGGILNDFLDVEHNPDGTLKKAPDIADAKAKADAAETPAAAQAKADAAQTAAESHSDAALAAKRFDSLADVAIASPAAGDALVYDTASSKWKNGNGGSQPVQQSITLMGDSITAQNGPAVGATTNGTTYTYDACGWWSWANIGLGQRFLWIGNTAVGGTTTATQLASQIPTVVADTSRWVCWLGGINDLGASATPDPTVTVANLKSGYDQIRAANKRLIVCTVYRSSPLTNAGQISAAATINSFIRSYARANPGVILFDLAALMTDPATGTVYTTLTRTEGDGSHVHPNNLGSQLMGQALAQLLAPITSPLSPLTFDPSDPYNLCSNGLFQGSSPTGWASSDGSGGGAPGTITRVNRTDSGPGWLWQAVLAAPGTGTGKINLFSATTSVTGLIGHTIVPRCYFEVGVQGGAMDWSVINHFYVWALVTGASGASYASPFDGTDTGPVSAIYFPRSGVFQGPPITIPVGATTVRMFVEIATTGAVAGGGTLRVGQSEIHDVTGCGY